MKYGISWFKEVIEKGKTYYDVERTEIKEFKSKQDIRRFRVKNSKKPYLMVKINEELADGHS